MGKVQIIKKSRKAYKCSKCGNTIEVGSQYYKGTINFGPTIVRCDKCKLEPWEVTTSSYQLNVGRIVHKWRNDCSSLESAAEEISDELNEILSEVQERFDAMPEPLQSSPNGELLQERINALEDAICELDDIDIDSRKEDAVNSCIDDECDLIIDSSYDDILERTDVPADQKNEMIEWFRDNLEGDIDAILSNLGI